MKASTVAGLVAGSVVGLAVGAAVATGPNSAKVREAFQWSANQVKSKINQAL